MKKYYSDQSKSFFVVVESGTEPFQDRFYINRNGDIRSVMPLSFHENLNSGAYIEITREEAVEIIGTDTLKVL